MSTVQKQNVTRLQSNDHQQNINQQTQQIKRRKLKKRLFKMGLCTMILAMFVVTTLVTQSANIDKRMEKRAVLEEKLKKLQTKEEELRAEIVKLNDEEYVAKLARDEYFFSKDGEVIFKISD